MLSIRSALIALFALFLLVTLHSATAAPKPGETSPSITDLAFMAGHWETDNLFGGRADEGWFAPRNGVMTGLFRLVFPDRPPILEFMVIAEEEGKVVYRFKHFNADYTVWESDKATPLTFELVSTGDNEATFEGVNDISPRTLRYFIDDSGALNVDVRGIPGEADDSGFTARFEPYRG